jgi:hypothetical protein
MRESPASLFLSLRSRTGAIIATLAVVALVVGGAYVVRKYKS